MHSQSTEVRTKYNEESFECQHMKSIYGKNGHRNIACKQVSTTVQQKWRSSLNASVALSQRLTAGVIITFQLLLK